MKRKIFQSFWKAIKNLWRETERYSNFELGSNEIDLGYKYINSQESEYFEKIEKSIESGSRLTFLLGEWGAGKTVLINKFMKNKNEEYELSYVSFFGVQYIDQARLRLISVKLRIALFVILLVIIYSVFYLESDWNLSNMRGDDFLAVTIGFLGVLFFINRNRWLYFFNSLFVSIFLIFSKKRRVVIIEDLDRSALDVNERWGFLSNLWYYKTQYIVAYGYSEQGEKGLVLEMAGKLDAKLIQLEINGKIVESIVKKVYPEFPFDNCVWLQNFPPRSILKILDDISSRVSVKEQKLRWQAEVLFSVYWKLHKILLPSETNIPIVSGCNYRRQDEMYNVKQNLPSQLASLLSASQQEDFAGFANSLNQNFLGDIALDKSGLKDNQAVAQAIANSLGLILSDGINGEQFKKKLSNVKA